MKLRVKTGKPALAVLIVAGVLATGTAQAVAAETWGIEPNETCDAADPGCSSQDLALLDPPHVVVYTTRAPVRLPDNDGDDIADQATHRPATQDLEASSQAEDERQ